MYLRPASWAMRTASVIGRSRSRPTTKPGRQNAATSWPGFETSSMAKTTSALADRVSQSIGRAACTALTKGKSTRVLPAGLLPSINVSCDFCDGKAEQYPTQGVREQQQVLAVSKPKSRIRPPYD